MNIDVCKKCIGCDTIDVYAFKCNVDPKELSILKIVNGNIDKRHDNWSMDDDCYCKAFLCENHNFDEKCSSADLEKAIFCQLDCPYYLEHFIHDCNLKEKE